MTITIKLVGFCADTDTTATATATWDGQEVMRALFDFAAGNDSTEHTVNIQRAVGLTHYGQTKILYEMSLMIDSLFNPDADEPYTSKDIEM